MDNLKGRCTNDSLDSAAIYSLSPFQKCASKGFGNEEFTFAMVKEVYDRITLNDSASGVTWNGVKFMSLGVNELEKSPGFFRFRGKRKDNGGLYAETTATLLIIGHYPEGAQPGNLESGVGYIGDYLRGLGM